MFEILEIILEDEHKHPFTIELKVDKEIIDLIRNNIAPDTHEQERLIEEIIEMIEGNK